MAGEAGPLATAIAEQDCACSEERKLFSFKLDLSERQIAGRRRVATRLRETLPHITVETHVARLEGRVPGHVVFEAV